MKQNTSLFYLSALLILISIGWFSCKNQTTGIENYSKTMNQNFTTYILVRHAEKAGSEKESVLLEEGMLRAERLANRFRNLPMKAVYSSDYTRTKMTAAPTAKHHRLEVTNYDPGKLDSLVLNLREHHKEGTVLVVGHSNTTPKLANLLVGSEVFAEFDESDYDSYFVVVCPENQPCIPLHLRD
jgi:broad specificity phosphatase PhoE